MKRFKKIISPIMVFLMLFINFPLPYLNGVMDHQANAAGSVYTDYEIVDLDDAWLTADRVLNGNSYVEEQLFDGSSYYYNVTNNVYLLTAGPYGSTILWQSSDTSVVDLNGTVTRPETGADKTVFLKATIYKGFGLIEKTFKVGVSSLNPPSDISVVQEAYDWLSEDLVTDWWGLISDFPNNLNMPVLSYTGCKISWVSSNQTVVALNGTVHRPSYSQGNANVTLTATIAKGETELQKTFQLTVVALGISDDERVDLDAAWLTDEMVLNGNSRTEQEQSDGNFYYNNITGNLNMPASAPNGSTIYWSSSNEAVVETNGVVHRPERGDKFITLKALLWNNWRTVEKTYRVIVKGLAPATDEESVQADYGWLNEDKIYYGRFSFDITYDVNLPIFGENGSTISWASSNEAAVSADGKVSQPSFVEGPSNVTLTATISKGEAESQKAFDIVVPSLDPTYADEVAIDKAWLTDEIVLNGNSPDNVKTRLFLPGKGQDFYLNGDYYHSGGTISWASSKPDVVATDGRVTRPSQAQGNQAVTLTATISYYDQAEDTKTFDLVVTVVEEFPLALKFDDFSDLGDSLQFNGLSEIVDAAIQFSDDGQALGGSVFTKNKLHLNDELSFSTYFSFSNEHSPFAVGNGGFTFTLQADDPTAYGQSLNALGADGITPSLSIAFKSLYYQGEDDGQAPTYGVSESLAVFYNGNNNAATYNGSHGDTHVWIEYDGPSKVLEIRTSYNADRPRDHRVRLENVDIGQNLISGGTNLSIEDVQDVYAGFTGSTGNANDKIQIHNWYFKNEATPIDLAPYNFIDLSEVSISANPPGGQALSTITASVYGQDGPVAGIPVSFSTTFGSLSSSLAVTDSSGQASVVLSNSTPGIAVVTAVAPGGAMASTEITLVVTDEDKAVFDRDWLSDERVLNGNSALNSITKKLNLPTLGLNGSIISWTSSNPGVVALDGTVTRPTITQGDQIVTLTANISNDAQLVQKLFIVTVKVLDEDIAAADREWLTEALVLSGNSSLEAVATNLNLPTLGLNGSTISWVSGKPAVVAVNGIVTRPTFSLGDQGVTLTATISKGSVVVEKIFNLTVKKLEPTDEEAAAADGAWLTEGIILNGNDSLGNIISNLSLPVLAPLGSTITWISSNGTVAVPAGSVNRPVQGNQAVTLTATVSMGSAAVEKTFEITVKGLGPTDAEIVAADSNWLTGGTILNGNSSLSNVLTNLSLPVLGPLGSIITWASTDQSVLAADGTVQRPYSQGDRAITLTATVSKGAVENEKTFNLTVKVLSNAEALAFDNAWLTNELVLNGNSDLNHVTNNLYLPVLGPRNTTIKWVSTITSIIEGNGTVKRPTWIVGNRQVELRATLINGWEVVPRTFTVVVLAEVPMDEQALAADQEWLQSYRALGQNLSPNSINCNLALPDRAYYGSSITWNSTMPEVISHGGIVTRPEYWEGHKSVTMYATLIKGGAIALKEFKYTVLAKPDLLPPELVSTTPEINSTEVLLNSAITITFDEDIKQGPLAETAGFNTLGIELQSTGPQQISARIDKNKLIITPLSYLASGKNTLVVPAGAVADLAGNPTVAGYELTFYVEQKQINNVEVEFSNPQDGAREVNLSPYISFRYNTSNIVKGSKFSDILIRPSGGGTPIAVTWKVQGNLVVSELPLSLSSGQVYELTIPAGAVRDRFENDSSPKTIRFRTKRFWTTPQIINTYPLDSQNGVDIHQSMEINFSEMVKAGDCRLELKDDKGNLVRTYLKNSNPAQTGVVMVPYTPLQPNTEYTVTGPYDTATTFNEFKMSFKTGAGSLGITKVSPTSKDNFFASINDLMGAPVNAPVELTFSSPVTRGSEFTKIQIADSQGHPVTFGVDEMDNKVVLSPSSTLSPAEQYTVKIPGGAYRGSNNSLNDTFKFTFSTARWLDPGNLLVNPSSTWLVNKPMTFDTSRIETTFYSAGYDLTSFVWFFGDGSTGFGTSPTHTYDKTGVFNVTLWIQDGKGFSNQIMQTVTIEALSKPTISVSHTGSDNLYFRKYNGDAKQIYKIRLDYNGINVPEEIIKVQLYKNGILQQDFGTITAGHGENEYIFPFAYEKYLFNGTNELVFTYEGLPEKLVLREPVIIHVDFLKPEPLKLKLYNTLEHKLFEIPDSLGIELNGVKKVAVKEWFNAKDGYGYTVKEALDIFQVYSIKIDGWKIETDQIYHGGSYYSPDVLWGRLRKPGVNKVTRDVKNWLFIEDVKIGPVSFELDGDWDGLEPGYYEMKTDSDRLNATFKEPKFFMDPGALRAGERLLFRMVSESGVKSAWKDAYLTVAPKPSLGMGPGLNVSYAKEGQYVEYSISAPVGLNGLGGGSMPLLDGVPLMAGDESFGLGGDQPRLSGTVDKTGQLYMEFGGGASYEKTTKKKKVKKKLVTAGYEVEAEIDGELWFKYDYQAKDWKLLFGVITLDGYGGRFWTKGYRVPKVGIGVDGEVEIGARLGGTLKIDKSDSSASEYSGIIRFQPIVTVSIQGGPDWVYVKGYVDGRIPAELHIPTGYAEAEVTLTAGVKAEFLTYTKDIYKNELFSRKWHNNKEKIDISPLNVAEQPLIVELDPADTELKPTPRNYLNRESQWLAGNQLPMMGAFSSYGAAGAAETNPQVVTMQDNIYPDAAIQLVRNGNELWLVWTDDNPERSAVNRTQMRYSVLKDGIWSAPVWLGQDGTADFTPVAASTGNGILLAWQNMNQAVADDAGLGALIESAEISVTGSVYNTDSNEVQMVNLTNDDKFDHSPKLAADGDKALLVWTKSEGLGFTLDPEMEDYQAPINSDSLIFSRWDGSAWSTAMEIQGSLPTVMNSSLTMHGEEGLLLYTLDMDNDQSTQEDRELFARIYNGDLWGAAIRLTDNQLPEATPKAVYSNGEWFITWLQDGSIMYKEGLVGVIKTGEFLKNVQNGYEIAVKQGAKSQVALVYKHIGENRVQNLSTSFYDIDSGVWSDEIQLTEGEGYVSSFSPVFTEDGKLKIAYTQAEIITEAVETSTEEGVKVVEYQNVSDKVDLRSLTYTPVHDLALDGEDGLEFSTEIPQPGTTVTVSATIRNQGDYADNATLDLYDGTPEAGVKLGAVTTEQPIPARSSAQVEIQWLVDQAEKDQYDIYAVVRADEGVTEIDEGNNTFNQKILTADIAVTNLECENIAGDDYLVTATVANTGSKALEGVKIQVDQGLGGKIIETRELGRLGPGQEGGLNLIISAQGLTRDEEGQINLIIRALLPEGIAENSTDNNTSVTVLELAPIVVESTNPGQGETQVSIQKPLILNFNMHVEKGAGFEQIILLDDELNPVSITKTLEGNTLTLTPQSPMAYNTRHTLTIPREALDDAYGHTMDDAYSMSFVTTTSTPEVVFAYPGEGMEEVAIDTEIKMQFNQDVLKGPTSDDIAIYGPNSEEVSASVYIEGQWLYINTAGNLDANTTYSLVIPRGTVKNNKDEALQEEYALEFTTVKALDSGNNDDDPGNNDDDPGKPVNQQPSNGSNTQRPDYPISYQTSPDGRSMAIVPIDSQVISKLGSDNEAVVTLDLSNRVKEDQIIQANLDKSALNQLMTSKLGLNVITGKGEIRLPAELIASLVKEGENSITLTIAVNNEKVTAKDRVSAGIIDFSIKAGEKLVTKFEPQVIVTIPLDLSKVGNTKRVIVCVYDKDTNSWRPVGGSADGVKGSVTFKTGHFSTYAAFETIKHFADVKSSWAKENVDILASRHLIQGKNSNVFAPDDSTTRAEFTAMLVRSLYAELAEGKGTFKDVPEAAWFADLVETAYERGLIKGIGHAKLDPNSPISREQLATIAYRLYMYKAGTETIDKMSNPFKDRKDVSAYAEEAVNFVANTGIMLGSGGMLEPRRSATRQEAAVVLYRLLEYMGEL